MRKRILHIATSLFVVIATTSALAVTHGKQNTNSHAIQSAFNLKPENNPGEETYLFRNDRLTVSQLYPNPASDYVQIDVKSTGNLQDLKLVIFNIIGQEVKTVSLDPNEKSQRINLKDLNPGMYPYQLVLDGRSLVTKKLIINN